MEFIMDNWMLIVAAIAGIAVVGYGIYVFVHRPTNEQLAKIREWLLYAVTEAEKELGGGTGKIKLRYVYDMFLSKFPGFTTMVSFESFSLLVDEALDQFRELLEQNPAVRDYVEHKTDENPVG